MPDHVHVFSIWADTSLAPFYGTVTSAAVFVVQAAYLGAKKNDAKRADRVATRRLSVSFWLILRIIGCVAWVILTIFSSSLKKGSYVRYKDQDFCALAACITSVKRSPSIVFNVERSNAKAVRFMLLSWPLLACLVTE